MFNRSKPLLSGLIASGSQLEPIVRDASLVSDHDGDINRNITIIWR
jgi:hypothetical protein